MYNKVTMSSGHGLYVRGAAGPKPWGLDEVNEARLVVDQLAKELKARGVNVMTFHDNVSKTQNENLNRIVNWHNSNPCELALSIHFNAYSVTSKPMGTECLYVSQQTLAANISKAIASNGFIDRGAKKRTDLFFLNQTSMPAVLLEIVFVDSEADASLYRSRFNDICSDIADIIGGVGIPVDEIDEIDEIIDEVDEVEPPPPVETPRVNIEVEGDVVITINGEEIGNIEIIPEPPTMSSENVISGKCSHFGGPDDTGVSASEGLAFIYEINEENQFLFLPFQPEGTSGLARRLNVEVAYCAMRWSYDETPKDTLLSLRALVRNPKTGFAVVCTPCDWGPAEYTNRIIDLSPSVMRHLGLDTDSLVEVTFPYYEDDL